MDFEQMKDDEVFFGAYNAALTGLLAANEYGLGEDFDLYQRAIKFANLALSEKWDREEQREFDFIQASEETSE